MLRVAAFLLLLAPASPAAPARAQDDAGGAVRLIVRGDDMGFARAVNEASITSYQDGIMTTVEVLVPAPWFPEAARLLRAHPDLDVGVHLALTSEWEGMKWRPLTHAPSLTDADGYFYPMIWPNAHYGEDRALKPQAWKLDEVEREWRAQIEQALHAIPQVSHLSCHMGCTSLSDEVATLYKRLAREYGLDIHLDELGVTSVGYDGPHRTPEEKEASFLRMLAALQPGTYLFLDHPAFDTPEMRGIHHVGYEDVATDRAGVTRLFTSAAVRDALERLGIQLIRYSDLRPR